MRNFQCLLFVLKRSCIFLLYNLHDYTFKQKAGSYLHADNTCSYILDKDVEKIENQY